MFAVAIVAAMFAGGLVGGTLLAKSTLTPASAAFVAATTPTPAPKSNEATTHEAGESTAQEAAENNGTFRPAGGAAKAPGQSNEDPTHEAGESTSREAAENAAAPASPAPTN
jgi:hypothetical protein